LLSNNINDIIKASAVSVPIIVIYLFYRKGGDFVLKVFNDFYSYKINKLILLLYELLYHILPIILIGLPQYSVSYVYLLIILVGYYFLMGEQINSLYYPLTSIDEINNKMCSVILLILLLGQILVA
jgi:hypothetical protein